ncbi:inorganic phosphate transporter [Helicobacter sp. MIT 05-5293]|uniref:Phosphate transporter n=1 Tax=uncultured Helicobacter sp. TaxID=175537 RepID=A0A650F3B7_9HELI|nr:inorganic phosphate transporter [Helicobacter sp. MIT 05-5293]QGT50385.1 putative phosphate permease [uncultured Helicobacter sp.]TLD82191.1 inorganic phosphate transporter [Helicobacter sp. MIT 05-5293]
MDIKNINQIEEATKFNQKDITKLFIVLIFFVAISLLAIFTHIGYSNMLLLVFATIVGGYMAMNIGANDVANNVGPAVGSRAITLVGAIIIAAICEAGGAMIAGGEVVNTIKSGIISPHNISEAKIFVALMLAALTSGAVWLHLATAIGAPVSTTHSLVGGIIGAGIVAGGWGVVNWLELARIASSWIISPVLGGIIAVIFLLIIKKSITYKENKREAAKRVVPILIFIMTWAFTLYLILKGLTKILPSIHLGVSVIVSLVVAIIVYFIVRPIVAKKADVLLNTKEDINSLFTIPLIFSAALLSFAHGANDVANAIGPLAAINETLKNITESVAVTKSSVPLWIMFIGGLGIALGLALYGPRLIKTVGNEITDLDKMRAFCIAMSAALTVLLASQLGLPVSSTHITIGAIFGVGFLREYLKKRYYEMQQTIIEAHKGRDAQEVEAFLDKFNKASIKRKGILLEEIKVKNQNRFKNLPNFDKKERKALKKAYKQELVKRSAINKIIASWLITVPASALLGAFTYFIIIKSGFDL